MAANDWTRWDLAASNDSDSRRRFPASREMLLSVTGQHLSALSPLLHQPAVTKGEISNIIIFSPYPASHIPSKKGKYN